MLYSKLQSRNDTVPTKRNDAAAFYQQATISRAKNQMLVVEFPSKPISSWLRKITQNDDASTNQDDAVLDMSHCYQLLVNQQASILHNDSKPAVALRKLLLLVSTCKNSTRHASLARGSFQLCAPTTNHQQQRESSATTGIQNPTSRKLQ
ncbi:hypothetical protein F511_10917 [Dorcoceras hygrometricum]|uniref:Uncharacterized protein n=1 Tax=Dorcoceras hygrometricum TaxID=472368 RepID=A0A2Z7CTT9_9LAMI|nr:hypothetical protein F511_10917 [Dorcoceras hygrometricum]